MLKLKVARPLATAAAVVRTFLTAPVPAAAELACGSPPEGFESGLPAGWTSAGNSPVAWGRPGHRLPHAALRATIPPPADGLKSR